MKYAAGVVVLAFMVTASTAQNASQDITQEPEVQELNTSDLKDAFNQRTNRLPDAASTIIGDENITLHLPETELLNSTVYSVETDGVNITSLEKGNTTSTTLEVWIEKENVRTIQESGKPVEKFGNMIASGKIRYETYSLGTEIKMTVLQFLSGFL